MTPAPIPVDEADRLQALRDLLLLDTPPEERYDRLARFAAENGLFVVEDARSDARFSDNPQVVGAPHIRFYAGAPLSSPSGHRIGTLCVLDTVPRTLGAVELSILDELRCLANETLAGKEGDE